LELGKLGRSDPGNRGKEMDTSRTKRLRESASAMMHTALAITKAIPAEAGASISLQPSPNAKIALPKPVSGTYKLTAEENERFLRVVSACAQITTHYELFLLMQGEMQFFLPQDILIAAWGDFGAHDPHMDVVSGLPGVRTDSICDAIVPMAKRLHNLWINGGSQAIVPNRRTAEQPFCDSAACARPCTLPYMSLTLVHGTCNKRDGHDSMYIALSRRPLPANGSNERLRALADVVIQQIDVAYRKVAALDSAIARSNACPPSIILSIREEEITYWVCQGKTNGQIARILGISVNTVKNHVHRIFDKLGANNRTQAVAKYRTMSGSVESGSMELKLASSNP
jgi:transcriptional regulator EpsA